MLAQQITTDTVPAWLAFAPAAERSALFCLLGTAGRSREEIAHHMLAAGPPPQDEDDALARIRAVIHYLRGWR